MRADERRIRARIADIRAYRRRNILHETIVRIAADGRDTKGGDKMTRTEDELRLMLAFGDLKTHFDFYALGQKDAAKWRPVKTMMPPYNVEIIALNRHDKTPSIVMRKTLKHKGDYWAIKGGGTCAFAAFMMWMPVPKCEVTK